jgi:Bacterial SH3 domain
MRKLLLLVILLSLTSATSYAQRGGGRGGGGSHSSGSSSSHSSSGGTVHVRGYYRKDGTYVAPHERSAPDGDFNNNWSTKGNVNPYTGREGTRVTPPNSSGAGRPALVESSPTESTESESSTGSLPLPREAEATPSHTTRSRTSNYAEGVSENVLPSPTIEIAVVISERANLREQPNQTGPVITEVREGNALVLTGQPRVGGWYSVVDVITGKEGWIHGNTIRIAYKR